MKLRELRIQHLKSIEAATIHDIGNINIFSGRNNSGKSTIFEALTTLQKCPIYPEISGHGLDVTHFSGKKFRDRIMKITVVFELNDNERHQGISKYSFKGVSDNILEKLKNSRFLKEIEYTFQNMKGTKILRLSKIRVTGSDGKFGSILNHESENRFMLTDINYLLVSNNPLTSEELTKNAIISGDHRIPTDDKFKFPFVLLNQFIKKVYSFSPFRSSQPSMDAKTTGDLANDGSNLVQRIFTMKQNEDENWKEIREFVKMALPDLGNLNSRMVGNQTITVFRDKKWGIEIDIHDMGSGIEQLLMIACVLISKRKDTLILVETPEHHLHPGAQRTLLQFIKENIKGNQVLITTHSPVFLSQRDASMHIVRKTNEGTKVEKVEELEDLSLAINELGSKNSDILLADFVLFVEGPTDEKIFKAWTKTLGIDFDSKNIFCITIGGSRNFDYYANSDVLQRISLKSPVPHLFIIDRDEKSDDTIQKIKNNVKELHVLERREIENYLLSPELILETLKIKAQGNTDTLEKLKHTQPKDIEQVLLSTIDGLKHRVILKRIKEEIGGGTFLPHAELENLIEETRNKDLRVLTDRITKVIQNTIAGKCGEEKIRQVVEEQVLSVNKIWSEGNEEEKKKVVPGEDVLTEVFKEFGLRYDKLKDGERIAQQMKKEDIPKEITSIIEKLK